MSPLDSTGLKTCQQLGAALGVPRQTNVVIPGAVPIGIEIEVKFSSYFPQLWQEFGLHHRGFGAMNKSEMEEFSAKCTEAEKVLLPKLQATVEAGVPRGNDRYYEFALDPVHDAGLLVEQVEVLTAGGVLPRDRRHSLQVTIGDIRATPDVYYLAMLLELHTLDPERIASGIEQTDKVIHTGWARKGRSGVFEKGAADLKHGSDVACELRPLQLPLDREGLIQLMRDASWGSNAIAIKQGGLQPADPEGLERWEAFVVRARQALCDAGLPDRNWGGGHAIDQSAWKAFGDCLQDLRSSLVPPAPKRAFRPG